MQKRHLAKSNTHDKTYQQLGVEGNFFNLINIYKHPTANIILNSGKLKAFLLRSRPSQGCPPLLQLFKIILEVLDNRVR